MGDFEGAKREFVKIPVDIQIRYKFLSKSLQVDDTTVHEGITNNLSGTGIVMQAKLPSAELLAPLLTQEVFLGINMFLPSIEHPIKALTNITWIECVAQATGRCAMGLKFSEIKKEDQDDILRYTIKAQITRKVTRQ